MPHPLALHHLSLLDIPPEDLPAIAREVGFSRVSVFVTPPSPDLDIFPRVKPGASCRAFTEACRTHGVSVHNIDVFSMGPETQVTDTEAALDLGAEIGAERLTALVQDPDLGRAAAHMAEFSRAAETRGIKVSIEFMKFSALRSIQAGAEFVARVAHPNLSLLVDPLHLVRTGGTVADLNAIDPALIGAAQFCDGPLEAPTNPFAEAVEDRGIPGEGAFPLVEFLRSLPGDCPLDIEVPLKRLSDAGRSPLERARLLHDATMTVMDTATRRAGADPE